LNSIFTVREHNAKLPNQKKKNKFTEYNKNVTSDVTSSHLLVNSAQKFDKNHECVKIVTKVYNIYEINNWREKKIYIYIIYKLQSKEEKPIKQNCKQRHQNKNLLIFFLFFLIILFFH
jgi:dipeptide/tripeptide permease